MNVHLDLVLRFVIILTVHINVDVIEAIDLLKMVIRAQASFYNCLFFLSFQIILTQLVLEYSITHTTPWRRFVLISLFFFLDFNECAQYKKGLCEQQCINTIGSYRCTCHPGYVFHAEKQACTGMLWCLRMWKKTILPIQSCVDARNVAWWFRQLLPVVAMQLFK